MADIFNRKIAQAGPVLTTDNAIATISGGNFTGQGVLLQNVQVRFEQQYNDIYELGSQLIYHVLARPSGRLSIGRIVGLTGASAGAIFDSTTPSVITFTAQASTANGGASQVSYTLNGVFPLSYGVAMTTQDMFIREDMTFAFTNLSAS